MLRAFRSTLNSARYAFKAPESSVDFLVIGGGVSCSNDMLVPGEEISSRNSEVIHAGLYYPPNSNKMRLCIRGRELLYARCQAMNIPFRRTGKLIVATDKQRPYIEALHAKAQQISWPPSFIPTKLLSAAEVHEMEPNISPEITSALWSPETGIVSSHALMESLEQEIVERGGDLVYATRAVRVDPHKHGWVVQMVTDDAEHGDAILAKTLINAAGLSAPLIANSVVPEEKRIPLYYARGSDDALAGTAPYFRP
ncbi:FAD dependent oxidoreductase-domain-containing protein [Roridomyces roridus]|uniref:L-2-hydroxyglutarate dehydrogenase, mitochondrial n=1 Tax=Roridomyces roridus TaxID=1738132 RepID=A0AAD7C3V6_9AGAR|nr:FAD dependent oxidoreductase-domain-containing protein [Roridomyces roridus]